MIRRALWWALVASTALAGGCATVSPTGSAAASAAAPAAPATPDPWENWNRKVFAFNEGLDAAVLKPVALAYRDAVPSLVRTGVDNLFGNFRDVWSVANHLMQGKVQTSLEMGMRVLTNTLFGLGGLLDPATEMKLERRSEDFGQTLGAWGLPSGPYLVLPVIGPSTVRDTLGFVADFQVTYTRLVNADTAVWSLMGLEVISIRTSLLGATTLIDEVALDKYAFIRDGYIARRRNALYDGAPPMDAFEDEPAEPAATPTAKPAATPPAKTSP